MYAALLILFLIHVKVPSRSRTSKGRGRGTAAGGDTAARPLAPPEVGKTKGDIESFAALPDEKEQDAEQELAQSVNGLMKEVQVYQYTLIITYL